MTVSEVGIREVRDRATNRTPSTEHAEPSDKLGRVSPPVVLTGV